MWKNEKLSAFLSNAYEKSPVCIDGDSFEGRLFTQADARTVLKHAILANVVEWSANGVKTSNLNLPIECLDDSSNGLNVFMDEVCRLNGVDEFTFSAHHCQSLRPQLLNNLHPFFDPIFNKKGYPSNGTNLLIFGGKYRTTPAGIHNDPCDVFLSPVLGDKNLHTWPWHFYENTDCDAVPLKVESRVLDVELNDCLQKSALLRGECGDVLYLPAGCWHVNQYAVPKNSFSFGVSVFKNSDASQFMQLVKKKLNTSTNANKRVYLHASCIWRGYKRPNTIRNFAPPR